MVFATSKFGDGKVISPLHQPLKPLNVMIQETKNHILLKYIL